MYDNVSLITINCQFISTADYKVYIPPGNLCCEKYRLATFAKFPAKTIEASILAMNGFYYTGDKSKIRCFRLVQLKKNENINFL